MDEKCRLLISKMVRSSETQKNDFQRRMLLDFVSENIQSRPAYKDVTVEEIDAEIKSALAKKQAGGVE